MPTGVSYHDLCVTLQNVFLWQERCPPVLDDFLYICDDAYTRRDIVLMEQKILRAIDFDLGIPLSYRFLRRYAKVSWWI